MNLEWLRGSEEDQVPAAMTPLAGHGTGGRRLVHREGEGMTKEKLTCGPTCQSTSVPSHRHMDSLSQVLEFWILDEWFSKFGDLSVHF